MEQSREPTNSTHTWCRDWESNLGHIGERQVLSPLRQLCSLGNIRDLQHQMNKKTREPDNNGLAPGQIDLFADTVAILISIVSKDIMGCSGGKINMYLPPGHPIIAIWNNRNQNGRRICKKVYFNFSFEPPQPIISLSTFWLVHKILTKNMFNVNTFDDVASERQALS